MRRWEFVEGTASKFWETGAEGAVVTVRYGRCGSDGRTQSKEYASAQAADAQVARTIAEKERKGYREVGVATAAPGLAATVEPSADGAPVDAVTGAAPAVDAVPDEDTFVLPAAWRRQLHPRRGGVPRAVGRTRRGVVEEADAQLARNSDRIQEYVDAPRSDPALVEQVSSHLAGSPSPAGAAALASIVGLTTTPSVSWTGTWAERHGLPFAALAVVELFMTEAHGAKGPAGQRIGPWLEARDSVLNTYVTSRRRSEADQVRALVAAADEETYRATVTALAESRTTTQRKILASYIAPSETGWMDELCDDPGVAAEREPTMSSMLYCSLNSAEQVRSFPHRPHHLSVSLIATVAEGIGTAVAPLLAGDLSISYYADGVKAVANALVEIPTDESFAILLDRAESKHVRPALLDAMHRYPVRALRLLAAALRDDSREASTGTRTLLLGHVGAHRDLVAAVLPTLETGLAEIVEPLLNPADRIADAPADALPPVLTSPPWSRPRTTVQAAVVTGLSAEADPAVEWLPGEQAEWAACSSWYTRRQSDGDWERDIAALRCTLDAPDLRPAWVYVHGPEELVVPLLGTWDPTDLWDGEDTLKPIAARFGLLALPLLLKAAPRQPSSLAPLLLPFVDVAVARHMANWSVRLKSTAATARAWFARHGTVAARFLVPDAVGKAGTGRRAAEMALLQIAAVHGDGVVREAADSYGPEAAEAIGVLLSADPLERLLPATMPALPGWSEPALLPQIAVASGGALPAPSVRHALMSLALSKPGEVYPGVAALKEVAEAESLAEFAWALFEQWRMAGLPAKDSWALHALGLLGDDTTVRRLTPVIRSWPGEGAHHRAVEGLGVLAAIGTDVALLQLHGIAQRVKFKALKVRAKEKIDEVAAGLGLTGEQLSDRLVPDFGLDADGSTVVDYGSRRFTVGFDEQLRPYVLDGDGKRRKDLPMPGARDDAELAPAERKRFMALKKDVRTIASDQVRRLEDAMVAGRSWTTTEFTELFVAHPLLWHLVRRLVWLSESDGSGTAFRVAEDRTFADVEDEVFALADGATVRLAHPLDLGDRLDAWSEVFADYEILQPFPQLGRAVFGLREEEAGGYRLTRFEGLKVPTGKVLGLERRGWQRGVPQDAGVERWISKRLGDEQYLVIALDTGIAVGVVDMFPDQTLETVWLGSEPGNHYHWGRRSYPLRFGDLDPVTVSELIADLTELTEGAAA
ncbi:DUF4132 domain-containing protein [Streptomyces sp. NBC_00234]|uniref:DUF4132 domain-containing protein n=1 Tax=Streptomyces sp. NBC_00234 TaxID=2903638 RepID=UPI002E2AC09B|nr:DUF4132 domain-containing protein [Streptomyces sp. NBC_00234]